MDYEKLHKDTINKLQQMVSCGKITVEVARGICADFVPESDDERIRKELIDFLEYYRLNNVLDSKTIFLLTDSVAWLGKQGEKGTNGNEREIPNSSWSEEDKRILTTLINYLEEHGGGIDGYECIFLADWLKSLKDRVQSQPRQEWSEENKSYLLDFTRWFEQKAKAYDINLPMRGFDICAFCKEIIERLRICENLVWENIDETQRTNAIIMLKEGARRVYTKDSIDKCVDWLKSLRPQSHWRPSDEQMIALQEAMNIVGILTITGSKINSLYQDLKKLKV